ncbi:MULTISPECIES: CinA family protein [Acetobacter]|nr:MULTISPECIES: nicotinamide-nucleotide amidohydrolase family protein [Acetobacter]ATI11224.1 CinA family protein [Acetobacter pomorum]AXC26437.1 CinA family protein [Acetobacter sp. JWB]KAA8428006.1 CinA family protein [Acetobacter pomorum]KAA8437035.1 CinA family protein [Acetobacter pomorum]KAA8453594.1 CinA family protein [Acetobacter pomorum]
MSATNASFSEFSVLAAAERTLSRLRQVDGHMVTAESCTGGLVAAMLTHFPGSSDVTEGGFVTYSNAMKQKVLGVPAKVLEKHGAVSAQTVEKMAEGALKASPIASISVAISGIAGPDGGSAEKPVGLVWFATAMKNGAVISDKQVFSGSREDVRAQAAQHAFELILQRLS